MNRVSRWTAWTLASAFALAAVLSWPTARDERRSAIAEAQTIESMGGPAALPWEDTDAPVQCDRDCPPRAAAAVAVRLAQEAAQTRNGRAGQTKARQAAALLTQALAARPASGEWWAWLAYARIGAGAPLTSVAQALDRSYLASPYLAHLSRWRIRLASGLWPLLTAQTRARTADEIAWLNNVGPQEAQDAVAGALDPAARQVLALALARPLAPSVPHGFGGGPGRIGRIR